MSLVGGTSGKEKRKGGVNFADAAKNTYIEQESHEEGRHDLQNDLKDDDRSDKKTRRSPCCCSSCCLKQTNWEPKAKENVFTSDAAAETKYPKVYKILDYKFWDALFVFACLASIFLFTFCVGFLIQSKLLWGLIHMTNALYTILLLLQWVQVILKAKVQNAFSKVDIIFSLISIVPIDLLVLIFTSLNKSDETEKDGLSDAHLALTLSRLPYLFRITNILRYLSGWEDQLVLGDFYSFLLRVLLYTTCMIHIFACIWHRVACNSFRGKHFIMEPQKAREELCTADSWIMKLAEKAQTTDDAVYTPFLRGKSGGSILWDHYFVSMYWSTAMVFRLGYGEIAINLARFTEVMCETTVLIVSWIFVLASVSGTLTSLLIESDTERESYLTRRFAINHYLSFSRVGKAVVHEVKKFYDYLWNKRKGVSELVLIDFMPAAMKAEIFFDIHKFVLEQMPLFHDLDTSFLMALSTRMTHSFHLTNEILYHRRDKGYHMYYVLKGTLDIMSADDSHPIACIKSGSAIGDIFLVHPYSHGCTVRCGSECDILALTRESVNETLRDYPQYYDILQKRAQERFEQCNLLLGLAAKYNEAPRLFAMVPTEMPSPDVVTNQTGTLDADLAGVREALAASSATGDDEAEKIDEIAEPDSDGLSLASSVLERISQMFQTARAKKDKKLEKRRRSVQEEAFVAFAADVNRTSHLAKDLGIVKAPLTVSPPFTALPKDPTARSGEGTEKMMKKLKQISIIKGEENSTSTLMWKFLVSICICIVLFYYPYMFAFRSKSSSYNNKVEGLLHLTDLIFAVDCLLDLLQIVVTPQKTLETASDILCYRMKTWDFYFRIFAFLPIEYIIGPMISSEYSNTAYFYLLKFNRFLQIRELSRFFQDLEGVPRISIMAVFVVKFTLVVFYTIHFLAIAYGFLLRDLLPRENGPDLKHLSGGWPVVYKTYEFALYWSSQIMTTAGFGDIPYRYDSEVLVFCLTFIIGTFVVTYLGAKVAAILANAQRRRIGFKQTYYGVVSFLKQRKFPDELDRRIRAYYRMQWMAHEGVLIPKERSAIWDAPEIIVSEVALAQALKYVGRVPIVKHTNEHVLIGLCRALKQYFVPPDECVLFEGDKRRELYIIVKGYCNVYQGKTFIGHLSEGNYFGLSGLIMGVNLNYRITTETHCLFFCLQFEDFVEIAKAHKFLRKDYRILRGEVQFDRFKYIITDPDNRFGSSHEGVNAAGGDKSVMAAPKLSSFKEFEKRRSKKPDKNFNQKCLRFFLLPITFDPCGRFMTCWVVFRVLTSVMVSYYVLAHVAFAFDPKASFIVVLVLDAIAWVDIYLMFHVSYYNHLNQLITDPVKTASNYFRGPFFIDLFACFPFDLIAIVANPGIKIFSHKFRYLNLYRVITYCRLNRCLQIYRLVQVGIKLNQKIFSSLSFITLLEVVPWMLVFLHILCCISVFLVCDVSANGDGFNCSKDAWLISGSIYEDTKTNAPDLANPGKMYLIAFYWTIVVSMRVGYGDMDLFTVTNRAIAIFVMIAGCVVATFLSSKMTACMVGEDSRRIEIRTKIDIVSAFLDRYKASRSVKRRVKEVYFNEWDKTKGISVDELFVALLPSLKADVMCHLYEDSIRQCPIFKTLDEPGVRMLASSLREVFLVEGEFIFQYGNITDEVFLVASGIVAAYDSKGDVVSYMGPGSLIGEMSALFGVTRLYTTIAATDTDVLVFTADDFLEFLELYPTMRDTLELLCENMSRQPGTASSANFDFRRSADTTEPDIQKTGSRSTQATTVFNRTDTQTFETGTESGFKSYHKLATPTTTCILDPIRVPLKHGQLKEKERELMLQDSGTEKKWWSVFVTFGRVPKTEMGAFLHIFQDKKRCNVFNFTIHPASPITKNSMWCVFNLLITAISCSLTSYEIAFTSSDEGESWLIIVIRYLAEIFFVVRIMGNFHLGYYDDSGALITDVKVISKRYLSRFDGFFLDIITTVPIYLIAYAIGGSFSHVYAANIRGIQLLRVVLFVRYWSETETDLRMKATEVKILKITILLCFIFHFCACAWYLVACYGMHCKSNSWMEVLLHKLRTSGLIDIQDEFSIASRYYISLAFVTTTITSTGLNDVTPRTVVELIATIFFIFGTVFIIGFLLGEMTQCLASQISRKIHYEHELSVVESHLAGLGLERSKRATLSEYYKLVWRRFKGMPYYSLLKEFPYPLRADIGYEVYGPNIRNARILGRIDEQILRQITARIRHEFYLPGGRIVRGGSVCDAMYFIKRGEVLIIDENLGIELCVETLYENDCFGEVKILLPHEAYRFSYVTRVETEVGVLARSDLDQVLRNFPVLRKHLIDKARRIKAHRNALKERDEIQSEVPRGSSENLGNRRSHHGSRNSARDLRVPVKDPAATGAPMHETMSAYTVESGGTGRPRSSGKAEGPRVKGSLPKSQSNPDRLRKPLV